MREWSRTTHWESDMDEPQELPKWRDLHFGDKAGTVGLVVLAVVACIAKMGRWLWPALGF